MGNKSGFLFPYDKFALFHEDMTDEQRGKVFDAILLFACSEEKQKKKPDDFGEKWLYRAYKDIVDVIEENDKAYAERCEINTFNGKRGGRPKKNHHAPLDPDGENPFKRMK